MAPSAATLYLPVGQRADYKGNREAQFVLLNQDNRLFRGQRGDKDRLGIEFLDPSQLGRKVGIATVERFRR